LFNYFDGVHVTQTTVTKSASTSVPLHPLVAGRWSPRAYDPTEVSPEAAAALLEAARWAPSAMNHQPWRFFIGHRGDATYKALFDALVEGNQVWASNAPMLILAMAQTTHDDGSPRAIAPYELGLAVGALTIQAHAEGLFVHQMGGYDAEKARVELDIPDDFTPYVVLAVGRLGDAEVLPDFLAERELADRERLPLKDIAFAGTWGQPAVI
jgi:nitroreductase